MKMCYEAGFCDFSSRGSSVYYGTDNFQDYLQDDSHLKHFLPSDKKERRTDFKGIGDETRTMIVYEAPHCSDKDLKVLSGAAWQPKNYRMPGVDKTS